MNNTPEKTFSDYIDIIKKRWWLFILLPAVTAAAILVISFVSQPEYIATERLQVLPGDTLLVSLFSRTPILTTEQQLQSVHDDFYDVIRSPGVAWKTIADLNLDMSAEELISRIDTQHVTEFITVSARMPSPELAKEVVTVHTQNAIEAFRAIKIAPAQNTLNFLNQQVKEQDKALAEARQALQKFQLEHEVSTLPDEISAEQDFLRRLTADRDQLRTEAARTHALAESYRQQAEESRSKAATLQSELDAGQTRDLGETTPITGTATVTNTQPITATDATSSAAVYISPADAAATRTKITQLLDAANKLEAKAQEQQVIAAGHEAAIKDYDRILDEREQQITFLMGLQDQYAELQNNVRVQQGSFDFLVDKTNEARLKVDQGGQGYLEVVSPARQPHAPEPKHTPQILLIGILASLLLALLLAFALELIERGAGAASRQE